MAEFITTNQAAKKICVSVETIYNMLRDGRLGGRYSKGNGKLRGSWLVSVESIELFKKHTTIKSIYQLKEENSQGTLF